VLATPLVASLAVNVTEFVHEPDTQFAGPDRAVMVGATVSIVNAPDGVDVVSLAAFVAVTVKVCDPLAVVGKT